MRGSWNKNVLVRKKNKQGIQLLTGRGRWRGQLLGTQEYLTKPHNETKVSKRWMHIYVVKKINS